MNTLLLQELSLFNFKGIASLTIKPEGKDISICGANKLGKTTTGDSLAWLLFGKDMQGRGEKKFNLKTLNDAGAEISHIDHSVEGKFLYNGDEIVLKKIMKEDHTRKRGEAKKTFTGNTTEYYIDGLKTTATKYGELLKDIAPEQTFQMLVTPMHFPEGIKKWEDRRKIVIDICGDISDEDIISRNKKLAPLPGILKGKTVEKLLPHLKGKRTHINDQTDDIPIKITENSRGLPDISGIDQQAESIALAVLNKEIKTKETSLSNLGSGGASAELTNSLAAVNSRISSHESTAKGLLADNIRTKKNAISSFEHIRDTANLDIKSLDTKKEDLERMLTSIGKDLKRISADFDATRAKTFEPVDGLMCSGECGQQIKPEMQEEAFNITKSKNLDDLNEQGKNLAVTKSEINNNIKIIDTGIEKHKTTIETTKTSLESATNELKELEKDEALSPYLLATDGYTEDLAEKERTDSDIKKAGTGDISGPKEKLEGEIFSLTEKRDAVVARINLVAEHAKIEKRNEELRDEEKSLSAEFEENEGNIFLVELFIKDKVRSLSGNIAKKFGDIKFKMFDQGINGGITPCCDVMVQDEKALVPFGSANKAGRANTAQKINNVLSEYYDIAMPVLVDDAEGINDLDKAGSQTISLVVTTDTELVIKS